MLVIALCAAPFTPEERSTIAELRFADIGTDRKEELLEMTFLARKNWVIQYWPTFSDFFAKFPPLTGFGVHVNTSKLI